MKAPTGEELLASLKARITDPEKQLILASIVADTTRVASLTITDPEAGAREARFLKAQLSNLAATEAIAVQDVVTEWMSRAVFAFVQAAFVA